MSSYAAVKGRSALPKKVNGQPAEISDEEKEAIAGRVRLVKQHMPEVMDEITAFHAAGMIDGLRCAVSVTVFEKDDHGTAD